ncbi:MAG: hypothetical protein HN521_10095 [Candidatus Latescibacteria bacterium]|nr:hypothetical protein [Candidatus Latescibacterota bacterium]
MKKIYCLICCLFLFACGGSGSPTGSGPTPQPSPGPGPTPQPTTPSVQDRSFSLSKLAIDSGVSLFEMGSPDATGQLDMRANGAYTLSFKVELNNFIWSETVTGTHTFSGNTLRLTPAADQKTSVVSFEQTLIIGDLSVTWQSDTQVVITLPIRPGAWRSEDTLSLTYARTQAAAKFSGKVSDTRNEKFDYVALMNAFRNRAQAR